MKGRRKQRKRIGSAVIAGLLSFSMILDTQAAVIGGQGRQEKAQSIETAPVYNPIAPAVTTEGTADPSVVYHDGWYYYVKMRGSSEIVLYKSKDLYSIASGECKILLSREEAKEQGLLPGTLWAPEIQYVEKTGKWYLYFTAEESGVNHKMYAMEGGASPDDSFTYKGYMEGQTNDWQIDGVLVEKFNNPDDPSDNQLYFVSSIIQRRDELGDVQDLGIYEMEDPLTFKKDSLKIISRPTYEWERRGTQDSELSVNEGPEVMYRNGKTFLVYSASSCWSRHYKLGMLTVDSDADFMNTKNWVKHPKPVFKESEENGAYGVGHHCFVYNEDTNQDFLVYHGYQSVPNSRSYATNNRDVRMQEFTWDLDGMPVFGEPTDYRTPVGYTGLTQFTDDFGDGKLDESWISYGGEWSEKDGYAGSEDQVPGSKLLLKDAVLADFTLEATLTASSVKEEGAGLLFRTSLAYPAPDAQCGYYFGLNVKTKRAVLGKFSDGWQMMSSVPFPAREGQKYHIKIAANGSNIAAYIDDMEIPVIKARDTQYRQGSVGIRAFGAEVKADSFSVKADPFNPEQPQNAFEEEAVYKLVNDNSGKVIGLSGGMDKNGTNIVQQADTGARYQQWRILKGKDGYVKLQNAANGKLMGVAASSAGNANVHLWEDDGTAGELWKIEENGDGTCKVKAQCSGRVLDVANFSKEEGANISQYTDTGTVNQRFCLVRVSEEDNTYTNPAALDQEYPDPYLYFHEADGYYYGMATNMEADGSSRKLYLYRSRSMTDVFSGKDRRLIAEPEPGRDIWAPEIHFINGKWYIYYSGGMRGYVLENENPDPMAGSWENKGAIYAQGYQDSDQIDGTVLKQNGKLYYIWCLWKVPEKDPSDQAVRQTVVISEMENPWTLKGEITVLSESEYDWESFGSDGAADMAYKTNEGPAVLQHGGKTFVTYSGSYCHTQFYRMGMLSCDQSADPMNLNNWTKSSTPVFERSAEQEIWSTGHNSFTVSPDGQEAYLVYHASLTNQNDERRYPCIQKISFDQEGMPVFGAPEGRYQLLEKPQAAQEKGFSVNLAEGKSAEASSSFHGYGPELAVDGNRTDTRWAANGQSMPQWLAVDLGDQYYLDSVDTTFEMEQPYEFILEYSKDGQQWKTYADYQENQESIRSQKAERAAAGRYVRIRFTADGTQDYWAGIYELEVYGAKVPEEKEITVTAKAGEKVILPDTVSFAFDGNINKELSVSWEEKEAVYEEPGTYEVKGTAADGGIPVKAVITVEGAEAVPVKVKMEAELAQLSGAAKKVQRADASGGFKVGMIDNQDAQVTFTLQAPRDGRYRIDLATGSGTDQPNASQNYYVNGQKEQAQTVHYKPDGWDNWSLYPVEVELKKGENTFTVTHSGLSGSFSELDYIIFYTSNPKVEALTLDGVPLEGFDRNTLIYEVKVEDLNKLPQVAARLSADADDGFKVTVTQGRETFVTLTHMRDQGFRLTYQVRFYDDRAFDSAIVNFGADPYVTYHDGYYYYCRVLQDKAIYVSRAKELNRIAETEPLLVYTPAAGEPNQELWAPEMHFLNGKWYIYYTAGAGAAHRMYALESKTEDALGVYEFKGKLSPETDRWAIDQTVLEYGGQLYAVWSGWEGTENVSQRIYIARMSDPLTITGERMELSRPEYSWELDGTPTINEGAQIAISPEGVVNIIYSASGSWTDNYCLGRLTLQGNDPMDPDSWEKGTEAVFHKSAPSTYSTGHAAFTKSPDGTEDYIVFHAAREAGQGWSGRGVRTQMFTWNKDGTPNFGTALPYDGKVNMPSGTPVARRSRYEAEDSTLLGHASVEETYNSSYGKKVTAMKNAGDGAAFTVTAETAGIYRIYLAAATRENGAGMEVQVNGGEILKKEVLPFNAASGNGICPDNWTGYELTVTLDEGESTIEVRKNTNQPMPDLDYLELELLKESEADKSELKELYEQHKEKKESEYTAESWKPFGEALKQAEALLKNEHAGQKQIDEAVKELAKAARLLVKKDGQVTEEDLAEAVKRAEEAGQAAEEAKAQAEQAKEQAAQLRQDAQAAKAAAEQAKKKAEEMEGASREEREKAEELAREAAGHAAEAEKLADEAKAAREAANQAKEAACEAAEKARLESEAILKELKAAKEEAKNAGEEAKRASEEAERLRKEAEASAGKAEEVLKLLREKEKAAEQAAHEVRKGQVYPYGGLKYTVTSEDKKTVSFSGVTGKDRKTISIPGTITIKEKTYKVTAVTKNALKGNKKLTKVTIGRNVSLIGSKAFYKDSRLKCIVIKSNALKSVGKNAFKGISKSAYIDVPNKKTDTYRKLFKKAGQAKSVKMK